MGGLATECECACPPLEVGASTVAELAISELSHVQGILGRVLLGPEDPTREVVDELLLSTRAREWGLCTRPLSGDGGYRDREPLIGSLMSATKSCSTVSRGMW
jgi:hypothetical protein